MKLLVAGLSLLVAIQGSRACSCLPGKTQSDIYCEDTYVLKVKIQGDMQDNTDLNYFDAWYKIKILHVYKSPGDVHIVSPKTMKRIKRIWTAAGGHLCGATGLLDDHVYIVSGTSTNTINNQEGLRLNHCRLNVPFSSISSGSDLDNLLTGATTCPAP